MVDRLRDGAFTSKLVVELSWVGFLCVLWLSTGAATASFVSTTYFANGCGDSTGELIFYMPFYSLLMSYFQDTGLLFVDKFWHLRRSRG